MHHINEIVDFAFWIVVPIVFITLGFWVKEYFEADRGFNEQS